MKKNRFLIIVVVIIVIAIAAKMIFFSKDDGEVKPAGGKGGSRGPTAVIGIVAKGSSLDEIIYASGSVTANEEVTLRPEMAGRVVQLNIKEGSKVNKGDLLVKINDADLQAQMRKLNGQLKLLEEKAGRQKALLDMNGISREAFDEMTNQVSSLKADLDFTRSQIEKTEIRAPFSGQVGLRYISEGSTVTPSDNIATIRQLNPVKIDFSVPEKYSGLVKSGDSIRFSIDGMKDSFSGKVYASEPGIDATTRTLKLRAISDNSHGKLFPGAFARIEILLSKNMEALMIPTQSVIPVLKGKKVFISQNGIATSRSVETGVRQDKLVEITSGIQAGDTVITTGIMQLRDSMAVSVKITPMPAE